MRKLFLIMLALAVGYTVVLLGRSPLPKGFVWISSVDPTIKVSARFAGSDNLTGAPVPGYKNKKDLMLTYEAASKLKEVQDALKDYGYGLVIYDAYRPQYATTILTDWLQNDAEQGEKKLYYPTLSKSELRDQGYFSDLSANSRGSTVDLGLVSMGHSIYSPKASQKTLKNGEVIPYLDDGSADTGSSYGLLHEVASISSTLIEDDQKKLRELLRDTMTAHGFVNFNKLWWRYTLLEEPFPNMYYNFDPK